MLLALVDHLRCTAAHAETWLVARADRAEAGWMISGVLGCPTCRTERDVRGGVVYWAGDVGRPLAAAGASDDGIGQDAVIRLGALLGFSDSAAPFVICGRDGEHATALAVLADAPIILIDPPDDSGTQVATILRGAPAIPLATGSVRGIALDEGFGAPDRIESAVRALAMGGRLVAPISVAVPSGIREMARDGRHWVGERGPDVITLARAPAPR